MKITLKPNDYAFIFRENGEVAVTTGESDKPEANAGETLKRVRMLGLQAMMSGNEPRMRAAEISAATLTMLTKPAMFGLVMAALGNAPDDMMSADPIPRNLC